MCGITGLVTLKRAFTDLERQNVAKLLLQIEGRGRDATGVFNGKFLVKMPVHATYLIKTPSYLSCVGLTDNLFLGHCRASTNGDPRINANNHPFESKSFIFAHNGIISNHKQLPKNKQYLPDTDSYAELQAIQEVYDEKKDALASIVEVVDKVSDLVNCCWLFNKETNKLYVWKKSDSGSLYYTNTEEFFAFSSDFNGIEKYDEKMHSESFPARMVAEIDLTNQTVLLHPNLLKEETYAASGYIGRKTCGRHRSYLVEDYLGVPAFSFGQEEALRELCGVTEENKGGEVNGFLFDSRRKKQVEYLTEMGFELKDMQKKMLTFLITDKDLAAVLYSAGYLVEKGTGSYPEVKLKLKKLTKLVHLVEEFEQETEDTQADKLVNANSEEYSDEDYWMKGWDRRYVS